MPKHAIRVRSGGQDKRTHMVSRAVQVLAVALAVGACATVAGATRTAGGRDIGSAPTVAANTNISGHLFENAFPDGFAGEYFKLSLLSGDRVSIRVESVGDAAPCPTLYLPGTDDFNFNYEERAVQEKTVNVNGPHILATYIAGSSGTYVLAMNNFFDPCYLDPAQWDYSFIVTAAHLLRLAMTRVPSQLQAGAKTTIIVSARDALFNPVNGLPLVLLAQPTGRPMITLARATAINGISRFIFTTPRQLHGQRLKLSADGGDDKSWTRLRVSRTIAVR